MCVPVFFSYSWFSLISCWLKYPNHNASVIIKVIELLQTLRNLLSLQLTALSLISLRISCLDDIFFTIKTLFLGSLKLYAYAYYFDSMLLANICHFLSTLFFTSLLFQISVPISITYTTMDSLFLGNPR